MLDGPFHTVIDLKVLNWHLEVASFKMETLLSIIAVSYVQEWVIKIDLKNACHIFC